MADKKGFTRPNYTQIPNQLLGDFEKKGGIISGFMADMGLAELKVTLAVCRMTFGFHQQSKRLSLTKVMQITGLSRQGVIDGAKAAKERGLIDYDASNGVTLWAIVDQTSESDSQASRLASQASRPSRQQAGQASRLPTKKESLEKETEKQSIDFSVLPSTDNPLSESNLPTEPINGKRNSLPEGDLLDCALHFATQDELKRPEGWQRVKKPIFEVCELVAELWFGGRIPLLEQGDDKRIKNWQWGAAKLLEYHDGDLGATKATLRGFYTYYVETNSTMALAGPQSLINVVSQFMAQNDTGKGGQKVLRIGR